MGLSLGAGRLRVAGPPERARRPLAASAPQCVDRAVSDSRRRPGRHSALPASFDGPPPSDGSWGLALASRAQVPTPTVRPKARLAGRPVRPAFPLAAVG